MTPDDPRRTCIFGHARRRNNNFRFGKDKTLLALRERKRLAPAQKVGNAVYWIAQLVFLLLKSPTGFKLTTSPLPTTVR